MTCNIKSLFYIFKKVKNTSKLNENVAKKIINNMFVTTTEISIEQAFRRHYLATIFSYYNILSIKFYSKNTKIDNNNVKILLGDWHDFFCEKMINEEYDSFYSKMHRLPTNYNNSFNLFKFLFWQTTTT